MRVAILGDIHTDTQYLEYAIRSAVEQGAKAMIQVGDFGLNYSDSFLSAIDNITRDNNIQLMAIRGNHDDPWWFRQYRRMDNVHFIPDGLVTTVGKKRVAFLGGAVSIDRDHREEGISWWSDERVNPHVVNQWMNDGVKADILITHDSPVLPDNLPGFTLPADISRDCDEDRHHVAMAVEVIEPDVVYHGHYHVRSHKEYYQADAKKTLIEGLNCNYVDLDQSMIILDW